MDLIEILRTRLTGISEGPHTSGLRAVLSHIEVAARHLQRGQDSGDESAYTDAVYRTNQAFEGSLKEAFRVLAAKDPEKVRPFDIENYFQQNSAFRSRVLTQFTRYRTEWRNPSTHDYKLDFDDDEALLAIVSVCAFAIVLIDQITERLSFDVAQSSVTPVPLAVNEGCLFVDKIAEALLRFDESKLVPNNSDSIREAEVIGAVAGYLTAMFPKLFVAKEPALGSERHLRPDMIVQFDGDGLVIEVKKTAGPNIEHVVEHVSTYLKAGGYSEGIVLIFGQGTGPYVRLEEFEPIGIRGKIIVIGRKLR